MIRCPLFRPPVLKVVSPIGSSGLGLASPALSSSTTMTKSWPGSETTAGDRRGARRRRGHPATAPDSSPAGRGWRGCGAALVTEPGLPRRYPGGARLTRAGRIDLAAFGTQFRPAILAAGEASGRSGTGSRRPALGGYQVNAALELEDSGTNWASRSRSRCLRLPARAGPRQPAWGAVAGCRLHRGGRPLHNRCAANRCASDHPRDRCASAVRQRPMAQRPVPLHRVH